MAALCQCGCGLPAPIATKARPERGVAAGQVMAYRKGHNFRSSAPYYLVDENGCWIWQRSLNRAGYGAWPRRRDSSLAHRRMYELHVGPIPEGLHLDHLCRVPSCVNPEHLEPVTNAENSRRGNRTRLTREQVEEIRQLNEPHTVTAARFGVHPVYVGQIRAGKKWVAV